MSGLARTIIKWAARIGGSALVFCAGVGPKDAMSNVSNWFHMLGLDGVATALAAQRVDTFALVAGVLLVAFSILMPRIWPEHGLRPVSKPASAKGDPEKPVPISIENQQALRLAISGAAEAIGKALGYNTPFWYDEAVASMAPMFRLIENEGIAVPDLRGDGPKLGTLRAHQYLNLVIRPFMLIGDNEGARLEADKIVPSINAMPEAELLARFQGLLPPEAKEGPSGKILPAPVPVVRELSEMETEILAQQRAARARAREQVGQQTRLPPFGQGGDLGYPFPKAVLQASIKKAKGTLEAIAGSDPHMGTIVMIVTNEHRKPLQGCSIVLRSLTRNGSRTECDVQLPVGREPTFTSFPTQPTPFRLLGRDISDKVTPEPFLIKTTERPIPLIESASYIAEIELRSPYRLPTLVLVQVDTGTGLAMRAEIIEQRLVEDRP